MGFNVDFKPVTGQEWGLGSSLNEYFVFLMISISVREVYLFYCHSMSGKIFSFISKVSSLLPFNFPIFGALLCSMCHLNRLPLLNLPGDNITYCQSMAIRLWAARKAGMYPEDPIQAMRVFEGRTWPLKILERENSSS